MPPEPCDLPLHPGQRGLARAALLDPWDCGLAVHQVLAQRRRPYDIQCGNLSVFSPHRRLLLREGGLTNPLVQKTAGDEPDCSAENNFDPKSGV